ncbi:MAG TPA: biotin/lipoyl-containing protein [Gaiellaceae bacterium]|jgi:acetyltransferase-like isoleucine patch superfamily enzyme
MPLDIVLTREDANSESAVLVEWLAHDGEKVRKGQTVCVIETSKSAIEIESPGEGMLLHLAAEGEEVELGGRIAAIASDSGELAELQAARESAAAAAEPAPSRPANVTRKAAELAARYGIDLSAVSKSGFVTVEDVEALIADGEAGTEPAEPGGPLAGISLEGVTLPAVFGLDPATGVVEEAFLRRLRDDPESVRSLPSDEKCAAYREAGAAIGEDVTLGPGTLIVAPRIVLEDGVEIGEGGRIECDEAVCIGALALFRPGFELRCRRAFVGHGAYVGSGVRIGGGGARDPQAAVVLGDQLFIGEEAFINPCRPVVVGREVFITMRSVIVTHNIGHSLLEGFENRFAPVVLEDRAQIGIGAVVYAGCRVGRESIVGSNSYVVTDIPAGKVALGVPARVAGEASRALSPERRRQATERIVAELRELLELRGHAVSDVESGFAVDAHGRRSQVLYVEELPAGFEPPEVGGETVVLTLGLAGEPPAGCAVIDLAGRRVDGPGGVLLDSVREFLRKRGIRCEPEPWRYPGGLV